MACAMHPVADMTKRINVQEADVFPVGRPRSSKSPSASASKLVIHAGSRGKLARNVKHTEMVAATTRGRAPTKGRSRSPSRACTGSYNNISTSESIVQWPSRTQRPSGDVINMVVSEEAPPGSLEEGYGQDMYDQSYSAHIRLI